VLQALLGLPLTNATLGQAVAVATVVSRMRWPRSLLPPAALMVANAGALLLVRAASPSREIVILGTTLVLAWAFGDASARRAAVRAAIEQELAARVEGIRLRSRLAVVGERLRIARELHDVVGGALDAVLVQAAAARLRLGRPEAVVQIAAIEGIGREVLTELDRFLSLLRRPSPDAEEAADAPPVPVPVSTERRVPARAQPAVRLALTAGPAGVLAALALVDALEVPAPQRLDLPLVLLLVAGATLPLLWRRRAPEAVVVAVAAASGVQLLLGMPVADGVLAVAVALHAVALYRTRRRAVELAVPAVAVLAVLAARLDPGYAVGVVTVLVVFAAGAVYIGDSARVACEHDASLLERVAAAAEEGRLRLRAVVLAERAQAARDLHDSIGHTMSLIVVQAGAARLCAAGTGGQDRDPAMRRAAETLAAIERSARSALADLDARLDVVLANEPPPDPVVPVVGDLEHLAQDVRSAGTPVDLTIDGVEDLPPSVRTAVFRLVQEGLTNVLKHAPGGAAAVHVERVGDKVRVGVVNAASPRPVTTLPSGSRGLAGLRERVTLFGGRFSAGPLPDGGFSLTAVLPLSERAGDRSDLSPSLTEGLQ
jgi:signal transduction histidine kinase